MATTDKNPENKGPESSKARTRPVRVIESTAEDMDEMYSGHIIPGANPPKNEMARGGFGNRDGKEGFGTDSSDGPSAVSVNEDADADEHPKDNMRTMEEGRVPDEEQDEL